MVAWTIALAVLALAVVLVLRCLHNYARLKTIPGPFLAAFSGTWRRLLARRSPGYGRHLAEIHQEYGEIVRLGPDFVSVCDRAVIAGIYLEQLQKELCQDDRDLAEGRLGPGGGHAVQRHRHLQEARQYEGFIDTLVRNIMRTIRRHRTLDVTASLRFFAQEFIDQLMLNDNNVDQTRNTELPQSTSHHPSSRPGSHRSLPTVEDILLRGPMSLLKRERLFCSTIHMRGSPNLTTPEKELPSWIGPSSQYYPTQKPSTVAAGTESMNSAFTGVFYFLLNHPSAMSRLRNEIDAAYRTRGIARIAPWGEIRRLPYLDAVMKEALRLQDHHTEMQVTTDPLTLSKLHLPDGTTVGWHLDALHFNTAVYGGDSNYFRPERWLVADMRRREAMEQSLLPLRVCTENHPKLYAAWMELKKTVVIIVREFEIQLLETEEIGANLSRYPPPSMLVKFSSRIPL